MNIKYKNNSCNNAFTLVELAIVIVIIGLLVGGVLQRQELVKSAKVNKQVAEFNSINAAYIMFKSKYNCIAGDCINATNYLDNTKCSALVTGGVCNGDGNQKFDVWGAGNVDIMRLWPHLILANLIKGGQNSMLSGWTSSNYRQSEIWNAAFLSPTWGNTASDSYFPTTMPTQNYIIVGTFSGTMFASTYEPNTVYSIDTKLDDGVSSTGILRSYEGASVAPKSGNCLSSGAYNLSNSGISCTMIYILPD